ncbi:MAG: hypothetical protein WC551_09875 [Patescibacteria group bacterium]
MSTEIRRFPMGKLVWTRGVNDRVAADAAFARMVTSCLARHSRGDWGELCQEDKDTNESALKEGGRLFSAYEKEGLPKIWIITEWDRSATTVLFPDEY